MQTVVRTTITLPDELLRQAKLQAVREKTTVSSLVRYALQARLFRKKAGKLSKKPRVWIGKYRLGITKLYNKRSDLYEDHIRRKMGF